jgi:CubicO group peptidase (beta-lactamase class C family)
VYQALPSNRENPNLRKIGWFSALAYFSNGVWQMVFPAGEFVLSQIVFVGISTGAVVAFGSDTAFGAPGAGGSMGFADPALRLGYGYVTDRMGMDLRGDPRDVALRQALHTALRNA